MASNNDPPRGSKDYTSSSKWRHQESSRYARHAGVNAPPHDVRPAEAHEGVDELASFLNSTRIEGTGEPLSAGGVVPGAPGSNVNIQPIVVNKYGEGNGANEGLAAANVSAFGGPLAGSDAGPEAQNLDNIESFMGPLGGMTDGKEVKCGPLLNYRRMDGNRWFGSVLVVTKGGKIPDGHDQWVPELVLKKLGYRAPNGHVTTAAPASTPASTRRPSRDQAHATVQEGETESAAGGVTRVKGVLLYADLRNRFWRFSLDLEMEVMETQWEYEIPSLRFVTEGKTDRQIFFVPSVNESMRIMFHSCNGFSVGTDELAWSGAALWNDVRRVHQESPFHVMIGGGDQIYNDGIRVDGPLRPWTNISNPKKRRDYPFPESLRKDCDDYYVTNYIRWYSTEPFAGVNGQIPQLNLWDDHDIIDGFGSYVNDFMLCDVFRGIGGTAYKYYLLFQHHLPPPISTYTTDAPQTMVNDGGGVGVDPAQTQDTYVLQGEEDDPSYVIGREPGPYVAEHSRSIVTRLGARIAFFGLDARTERTRHQVNYPETYQMIYDRVSRELANAAASDRPIQHLVVLLGIPIAYPRLTWIENLLSSPLMAPIKLLNKRLGFAGAFINKFDGSVDLVDDLDDHYTARTHKRERFVLMKMLQDIAATYSVRVTILSGDVHLAAVGRFYSNARLGIPVENDHRYMTNIVSSAIVNKPPPSTIANLVASRNIIHNLDDDTDETLLKMFDRDPGEKAKANSSNGVTMPSRNWAMITECSPTISRVNSAAAGHEPRGNSAGGQADGAFLSAGAHSRIGGSGTDNRPHSARPSSARPSSARPPSARPYSARPSSALPDGASASATQNSRPTSGYKAPKATRKTKNAGHSALGPGEVEAGTTNRAADPGRHGKAGDGALDVSIRVERNQHDRNGVTTGYGMFIPGLRTGRGPTTLAGGTDWEAAFLKEQGWRGKGKNRKRISTGRKG